MYRTIKEKETMNLNDNKQGNMRKFGGGEKFAN